MLLQTLVMQFCRCTVFHLVKCIVVSMSEHIVLFFYMCWYASVSLEDEHVKWSKCLNCSMRTFQYNSFLHLMATKNGRDGNRKKYVKSIGVFFCIPLEQANAIEPTGKKWMMSAFIDAFFTACVICSRFNINRV